MLYKCLFCTLFLMLMSQVVFSQGFPPSQVENFNSSEFILAGKVTQKSTSYREVKGVDNQGNIINKTIEVTSVSFQIEDNLEDENFQPGKIIDIEIEHYNADDLSTYGQAEELESGTGIIIGLNSNLTLDDGETLNYSINTPNVINAYGDLGALKEWVDKVRNAGLLELNNMIKEEWSNKGLDEKYARLLDEKYEFVESPNSDANSFVEGEESNELGVNSIMTSSSARQDIAKQFKLTPTDSTHIGNKQQDVITTSLLQRPSPNHKQEKSNMPMNIKLLFIGIFSLAISFFVIRKYSLFN